MMIKIYIAGKMRGEPCYNFERFFYHAHRLRLQGFDPINPAEHDVLKMFDGWRYTDDQYESVIEYDLELIRNKADAIFMMDGWRESPGAKREYQCAQEKGIPIMYEEESCH